MFQSILQHSGSNKRSTRSRTTSRVHVQISWEARSSTRFWRRTSPRPNVLGRRRWRSRANKNQIRPRGHGMGMTKSQRPSLAEREARPPHRPRLSLRLRLWTARRTPLRRSANGPEGLAGGWPSPTCVADAWLGSIENIYIYRIGIWPPIVVLKHLK